MSRKCENLHKAMCAELEKLDAKYAGGQTEMTTQDAEKADLLYHALKSAATYYAMQAPEEWEEESGRGRGYSGRERGGRYPEWTPYRY